MRIPEKLMQLAHQQPQGHQRDRRTLEVTSLDSNLRSGADLESRVVAVVSSGSTEARPLAGKKS